MRTFDKLEPMNPILCAFTFVFLLVSPALAQPLSSGWFGSVGGGLLAFDNGAFSRRLQSYTPAAPGGESYVYSTETFSTAGYSLDASGGVLLSESFILGASGQMISFPTVKSITAFGTQRDEYNLTGGGGGLDIGYALVNDDATLVYPFLQAGYYGYALDYTNNQSDSIPFFEGKPVAPGATASYSGAAPRIGIGVGFVRMLGVDGATSTGGFAIAARLSWGVMPSRPEWKEPDGTVVNNGGLTPAYNGVALSIQIGGGMGWR